MEKLRGLGITEKNNCRRLRINQWPQTCRICLPSLTILSGLSLKVVSSFIHLHSQDLSRLLFRITFCVDYRWKVPFLLLHFRCSTLVLGYRFPIPHSPFPIPDFSYLQMKVLFAWLRILCISKIIVRKLPLNSIHESFEEGRLLLTLFSLAA